MIRDNSSKALINNDVASLNKYKIERDKLRQYDRLRQDVIEIKKTLSSLCERLDKIDGV
jgi:hypothetical protein